jgi:3-hydroxyacyl-CoA dehydrogenase
VIGFDSADTHCAAPRDGVVVLTLTQPRPSITTDVLDSMERALDGAAREGAALVIASGAEHFAWGADLHDAMEAAGRGDVGPLERALQRYQQTMLRLRHATVPTVAAVRGVAISGGCEVLMHCTHVVLHRSCVVGLAEASIGVVPGGGGLKELVLRAARSEGDLAVAIEAAFDTVAATRLARGPEEAVELGWLEADATTIAADPVVEACRVGVEL